MPTAPAAPSGPAAATPGVILITGVMASGKSTVAALLAERLPRAAHIRGDAFRRMIVSGRAEMTPAADSDSDLSSEARAQLDLRQRLATLTADEYAAHGFTAVVQDIVLGPDLTAWVRRVRTRPLYVVVLAPSPETVAARDSQRGKTGYGLWTVESFDRHLRDHTPRIGLWLDTSAHTPEQTVAAVLANLSAAEV
jgi:cytidylate kinase